MQQQTVVRNYRAQRPALAEQAYREDAAKAVAIGWFPVAHAWSVEDDGYRLTVNYEFQGAEPVEDKSPLGAEGTAAEESVAAEVAGASRELAYEETAPDEEVMQAADAATDVDGGRVEGQGVDAAFVERDTGEELVAGGSVVATDATSGTIGSEEASSGGGIADFVTAGRSLEDLGSTASPFDETGTESPFTEAGSPADLTEPEAAFEPSLSDEFPAAAESPFAEPDAAPDDTHQEYAPASDAATGDAATGDAATGDAATSDAATGSEVFPATPSGDEEPETPLQREARPAAVIPDLVETNEISDEAPAARRHFALVMEAIDLHCAGEPLRLIRSGIPPVPSAPILERRRWMEEHGDYVRRVALLEPRGHRDMYGAVLLEPHSDAADVAVLFMHNAGYSTMCGHGTIAIATALIEEGLYRATEPETVIRFEAPAGIVTARVAAERVGDAYEVSAVRFTNVPSYIAATGLTVAPDGVSLAGPAAENGALRVDIGFGGAYYGIVDAGELGLRVVPAEVARLTAAGSAITDALRRDFTPEHPLEPDLNFVYGTIIVDREPATAPDGEAVSAYMRNVTVFGDGQVDRSPCGSGTSALLTQLFGRGRIRAGQDVANAGITGEVFWGRVEGRAMLGDEQEALLTSVAGTAFVTGYQTLVVDDRDSLGGGFRLS